MRRRKRRATAVDKWQLKNKLTQQYSDLFTPQGMNDTCVSRPHGELYSLPAVQCKMEGVKTEDGELEEGE